MNVGAADSLSPNVCLIKMIYCYAAWFCQGGSSEDFTMSRLIGWPLGDPELLGVLRCQTRFWRELHVEVHDALRSQERLCHPFTDRGKSGSCAWRPILLVWQKWIGSPSPQSFQVDQHWLVNPLEIFSDLKALNMPTDQTMYQICFTKKIQQYEAWHFISSRQTESWQSCWLVCVQHWHNESEGIWQHRHKCQNWRRWQWITSICYYKHHHCANTGSVIFYKGWEGLM